MGLESSSSKKRPRTMADEEEKEEEETTFTTTKEEEEEEEEDTMRVVPVKVVASGGTALVRGLPSNWDERAMRKALDDMKATGHTSIKKRKGWTHAFVTFNFPSERKGCLEKLRARAAREGGKGGGGFGKKVTMRDAKEKKDGNGKTKKTATTEAKEAVCPLWNVTYSEQLKRKKAKVKKALAMVTEMVGKTNEKFKKSTRRHHHTS